MSEIGKIRIPESSTPNNYPEAGKYLFWINSSGEFKKMDSSGVITNLTAQELADLTDVEINAASDGQVLSYNSTSGKWENVDPAGGNVDSVFGRTGVVVAEFGDYNADQVDDSATTKKFATQAELDAISANTARWTADPVKIGAGAGATNQSILGIAIGNSAGSQTQGEAAVAIGDAAGATNQGAGAFAFGQNAGNSGQGANAVGLGSRAGESGQGVQCLALGFNAGQNNQGDYSVAIGRDAGSQTQSSNSVAIGNSAGKTTQGTLSVAIGYNTGLTRQSERCIAIGNGAGLTDQPSNTIVMANGGNIVPSSTNRIVIGASNYAVQIGDGNVTSVSDSRDKYDIQDIPLGLDFVNALQPKFYKYDIRELYEEVDEQGNVTKHAPDRSKAGIRYHSGFIAQDVKATMDSFGVDFGVYRDQEIKAEGIHKERAKDKLSLCYFEFIAIQTKAIQELSAKVALLENRIAELEGQ